MPPLPTRLMAALGQTGRKKAPSHAARAQTAFDCWLEMTEDQDPAEDIARCKGIFEDEITEVELILTRDGFGDAYLVFFAWDQATLTPVALTVTPRAGWRAAARCASATAAHRRDPNARFDRS